MYRYEMLLLTVPEITEDEAQSLESNLDRLIKETKGTTISFERWGKYRLAYPVRKNDYGIYFLLRFEVDEPQTLLENIKSLLKVKLSNIVMRNMVSALSPKKSLAYQRAPSLEETPSRDVDSFLKEHKMEGLLSSMKPTPKKTPSYRPEEKVEEVTVEETAEAQEPEEAEQTKTAESKED